MVVNPVPSLAQVYYSLLQSRAAHSNTGGPPLDTQTKDAPKPKLATTDPATPSSAAPRVNILA